MYQKRFYPILILLSISWPLISQNLELLKDCSPVPPGGDPADFTMFNQKILFSAYDTLHGRTIWISDGSEAGTHTTGQILPADSYRSYNIYTGNSADAWYIANNQFPTYGLLCSTNGSATVLIDTLHPAPITAVYNAWVLNDHLIMARGSNVSSIVSFIQAQADAGSLAETGLVESIYGNIVRANDKLYYLRTYTNPVNNANIQDLMESDGTPAGTVVKQEHIAEQSFQQLNSVYLLNIDGKLAYFNTFFPPAGQTGIQANLHVQGFNKLSLPSGYRFGSSFALLNNKILFEYSEQPTDQTAPLSLFAFDGTNIEKLMTYPDYGFQSSATFIQQQGAYLYFRELTAPNHGHRLWRTDGTAAGTQLLFDTYTLPGVPDSFDLGDVFIQPDGNVVFDIFKQPIRAQHQFYNYTVADSSLTHLFDFNSTNPNGAQLEWHHLPNGVLIIAADDGQIGRELWKYDLQTIGTQTPDSNMPALRLYPNPAGKSVRVDLENETNAAFALYDVTGKIILQKTLQSIRNQDINLENLLPGVYWAKLVSADGRVLGSGKLVKE